MRGRNGKTKGNGKGENVRVRGSLKGIEAGRGGWDRAGAGCLKARAREKGRSGGERRGRRGAVCGGRVEQEEANRGKEGAFKERAIHIHVHVHIHIHIYI
jgi:hypothetical protein